MSAAVLEGQLDQTAIIGMACRFPGARNVNEFWRNLCDGVESISFFSEQELLASGVDPAVLRDPCHVRAGSVLEDVDLFDAAFFDFSPRQAELTDPQHRLFLECAWEALESAGYDPATYPGQIGIFAGSIISNYLLFNLYPILGYAGAVGNLQALIGNDKDYLATHVSYKLNLRGPSVNVQTACSTSLVAVHLASQSLLNGECDMALAGGVAIRVPQKSGYFFQEGSIFSPEGRCRPFDAKAQGTIFGNGVGIVVLKRLADAIADGDRIEAVVKGSAVNNDGSAKVGYTAPGEDGQAAVIAEALSMAQVGPETISYIETHGTGTPLGDPIEIAALTRVFRAKTEAKGFCALGAVKSNLGHLESAAGIAGLIKTVLALQHKQLPPSLNFEQPNPQINFADSPFYVNTRLSEWKPGLTPRRAGVSSFGIGGTNAHVVLEEAPLLPTLAQDSTPIWLLPLSARSPAALRELISAYHDFMTNQEAGAALSLRDICYTASLRRRHRSHRLAVVGHSHQELTEQLAVALRGEVGANRPRHSPTRDKGTDDRHRLAFVFSGQGAQWFGMGRQLLAQEPVFREAIQQCDQLFRQAAQSRWSLLEELSADQAHSRLDETEIAQPAIFAMQVALAALWRSWGIVPDAVVGHSVGEVAAAHVAGTLSLAEAAKIVFHRGRLMQRAAGQGAMAAVGLTLAEVKQLLETTTGAGHLSIAAINSPKSIVLSGETAELTQVLQTLQGQGTFCRRLPVNYAFHSVQMEPFQSELVQALGEQRPQLAAVPFYSTVNGRVSDGRNLDASYWGRNIREPVLFSTAVHQLLENGHTVFVEISPHPVLRPAIEDSLSCLACAGTVVPSLRREVEERAVMLESLGVLYQLGLPVNWDNLYPNKGQCVRLPAYPWQRQRYWLEPAKEARANPVTGAPSGSERTLHPLLGRRLSSPLKEIQFEAHLSLGAAPYLDDHRVCGRVVFPAAACLEMVSAAASVVCDPGLHALKNLVLREPLILDETRAVQLILTPVDSDEYSFQISSQKTADGNQPPPWRLHVTGSVHLEAATSIAPNAPDEPVAEPERASSLAAAQARCQEELPAQDYYKQLRECGLEYGPSFRGIEKLWRCEGEALGLVKLPAALTSEAGAYAIHPAMLDACLQVLGVAFASDDAAGLYLPMSVEVLRHYTSPGDRVWSYAVLRRGDGANLEAQTGDVCLFDQGGQLVAHLIGLCFKRTSPTMLQQAAQDRLSDSLYQLHWQPKPRTRTIAHRPAHPTGPWLIFADRSGVGQTLARSLQEHGEVCTLVFPGQTRQETTQDYFHIDPTSSESMRLLAQNTAPYCGVVHLWGLDATPTEMTSAGSLQIDQAEICGSVLHLIQAVAGAEWTTLPRLWLVTRGAQSVIESAPPTVAQAPLWGLGRVIALEHPDLHCVRMDLDPNGRADEIQDLLEEIFSPDEEDQVAFRHGTRYVPRLVHGTGKDSMVGDYPQARENLPLQLTIPVRGVLDNLILEPTTRRQPEPGEVEICVYATGLNFRDVLNALNMYPGEAGPLGLECAGKIVAVGEGVRDLQVGDPVVAFAAGAFRTFVTAPAELVALKPEQLSFEEAATTPVTFTTAYYGLHHQAKMSAGDRVLIHAAAGGVGLAAVQLAQRAGAQVFATASSPEKQAFLRSLGVQHIMNSRSYDFAAQVMESTGGQGVDIVLNSLSGEFIPKSLSVLRANGRFVEIGKIGIWDASQVAQLRPDVSYFAFDLGQESLKNPAQIGSMLRGLMETFKSGTLKPLPRQVFRLQDAVNAFRTMTQAKHIGKIVVAHENRAGESFEHFRADSSYLITGGLGDLGLCVARWMAEQGARHLVLLGRSDPTDAARQAVREMEKTGVQVLVVRADVADESQVARVLGDMAASMPPLRGIVHAAGILDDSVLLRQDWGRFAGVLAPKIQGAWNLHAMTLNLPLEFFVLFSSMASLLGSPGQGNYAAANAFLDALAHYRRARGLPALSVNWGAWGEIGMAARHHTVERMVMQGVDAIAPQQGVQVLGQLMRQNAAQVAVLPINWPRLMEHWGSAPPMLFPVHSQSNSQRSPIERSDLLRRLEDASPHNRRRALMAYMREQAVQVLGLDPSHPLNPQQPLNELGLDSLMAIELRNTLGFALGRTLPATLLFDYPTLESLSEYLAQMLDLPDGETHEPLAPAESETGEQGESLPEIEQLSEEQVEALLAEELAAIKALENGD